MKQVHSLGEPVLQNSIDMKKIVFIVFMVLLNETLYSQQVPLISQYMVEKYLYNPACAGSEDRYVISLAYRNQWTGFSGAPKTGFFSMHGPISGGNNVGFLIFSDKIGAFSRMGIYPSYAYQVFIDRDISLHFGIQAGIFQQVLNGEELNTREPDDPSVPKEAVRSLLLDVAFGSMLKAESFYIGIALPHLINSTGLLYADFAQVQQGLIRRHLIAFGGALIAAGDKVNIEPSMLLKITRAAPIQLDVSCRAIMDYGWLGLTYRSRAAIAILAGLQIVDAFQLGYSIDIATTELQNYSNGSHEIVLRFLLKEKRRSSVYFK